MGWNWLCAIFIVSSLLPYSDSACTFPSIFSGEWWDSNRGVLTFGSDNISGLSVTIYGTDLQNWDCWQVDGFQGQNDGGTVIIKARDSLSAFGVNFYVYLCLNLTRISAYSFYYYQMYNRQTNANNERVFVTDAHEGILTKDTICKKQLDPGFDAEFKLLLKKGSESDARQELPVQLLGNFEYTFMDTSGSYCSSPVGQMETCVDKKTMVFDYTKCRKEIAYSTSGNLSCVATLQKASHIYVMMYNFDPAEPSYRFTCFVVSSDGTSASYVYKNCSPNQSPDTLSPASDGSYTGGKLSLKMNDNSNYETVWTTRGQTTMSVNVHDITNVTVQSTHHDTTNVTVQSTHQDTTNVTVQSTHHDTTNVTVQSTHQDTTNVTVQSTHHDTTNVTVQSTHHDTTNVTVQSTHQDTTNVTVQSTHQDTTNVTVQSTHQDTTNVTVQSTHQDTTNVTVQSTHQDTTNVTVQSTHQDTTNVTVQTLPPKVTQTPKPTELSSGPTAPNKDTMKYSDSQEKTDMATVSTEGKNFATDMATVSTEGKNSAGAIVAIGVTIGVLSAVVITVVIIYCVIKRRSPSMKRKLPSFLKFSN